METEGIYDLAISAGVGVGVAVGVGIGVGGIVVGAVPITGKEGYCLLQVFVPLRVVNTQASNTRRQRPQG